jgi:AcrR family transcriptional regulator
MSTPGSKELAWPLTVRRSSTQPRPARDGGWDGTAVDDMAGEAGSNRNTVFRSFGSREAVLQPDDDMLLSRVGKRLRTSHANSALAVVDVVKIVQFYYLAEGDRARERYRLTSAIPTPRERELVSGARCQQLFRRYLSQWGDGSNDSELRAEVTAAAVVAAVTMISCADGSEAIAPTRRRRSSRRSPSFRDFRSRAAGRPAALLIIQRAPSCAWSRQLSGRRWRTPWRSNRLPHVAPMDPHATERYRRRMTRTISVTTADGALTASFVKESLVRPLPGVPREPEAVRLALRTLLHGSPGRRKMRKW